MAREILLVTPIKDEANYLEEVIRHVLHQTVRPAKWILVDDHSMDGSTEICRLAEIKYPWIKALILEGEGVERQLGSHVYEVQKIGFDYGIEICRKERIPVQYLGLLDADMYPETNYFERLIQVFEDNAEMGIVSGGVYLTGKGKRIRWEESQLDWPRGGARLMRRECFEDIGRINPVNSGDTVLAIRAIWFGYKVGQFKDIKVVQTRPTSTATGIRAGFYQRGIDDYFLGYSLSYALTKGVMKSLEFSILTGFCYLAGYVVSFLARSERIKDPVVRDFCSHRLLDRIRLYARLRKLFPGRQHTQ